MVIRSATQVPFHVRRILAPVLGLPEKRIRVIKPRIGGGFGGKQETVVEDICAHLTLATGQPVRLEYSHTEEFIAARSRHPQILRLKTGVRSDGSLTAIDADGPRQHRSLWIPRAHRPGEHGLESTRALSLPEPALRDGRGVHEPAAAGAMRGYGAPQGLFALEVHMDELPPRWGSPARVPTPQLGSGG